MIKSITISLYNRPNYTKILLDALSSCHGIEEYSIFIFCEPAHEGVIDLAKRFLPKQSTVHVNSSILGCNLNIFQCIDFGFTISDYHIHFEDDTIPGKDCLRYFEWCNGHYYNNKQIFTVTGYNKTTKDVLSLSNIRYIGRIQWFTPWSWATWKDRWEDIREDLRASIKNSTYVSWDCMLNQNFRGNRYQIIPLIPRCQNIGANNGVHVPSAEWHRDNHFNEYWIETIGKYTDDFEFIHIGE